MAYFNRRYLFQDLLAGVTGAVAGAPQAMGFALIAGISPVYGLYTAVVTTIVAAVIGSSTYMTVGPTNALALVVGTTLLRYVDYPNPISIVVVITLLVGVFQFMFGVFKLGSLTRFVSNAVMTGFITGAGLLIMLGQISAVNGYHAEGTTVLGRVWDWVIHLPQSDPQTTFIGVVSIVMIATLHHTRFKSIATLVTIILTSFVVLTLNWDNVLLVRDISPIPSGLPIPTLPDIRLAPELLSVALALAVLGSVQSAALTQNIPEPDGSKSDMSRDLIGQGLANVAGSFFQNMPAAGSLSRTAVNISAGARTKLANITAGVLVLMVLLFLGPMIERITEAALAGHLIVAAASLLNMKQIQMVWRVNITARLSMVITFLSTLILPLEYSIYLGVGLSLLMYVYTSAENISIKRLVPVGDNHFRQQPLPEKLPDGEPVVFSVSGNLYFAAVKLLEESLPHPRGAVNPVVILRLRENQYLGSTGIRFLSDYNRQLQAQGGKLILAGIGDNIRAQLERTNFLEEIGEDAVFYANDLVFGATEQALEYAKQWLAQQEKVLQI
ncbi:MAG: SulP family inorganic anion transporter [Anaerolineae bacterium]